VTLVSVVWRDFRAASERLISQRLRFSCPLGLDGPGRDRTCDLGIKSGRQPLVRFCARWADHTFEANPLAAARVLSDRRVDLLLTRSVACESDTTARAKCPVRFLAARLTLPCDPGATRRGACASGPPTVWALCEELGQLVDVEQELAELGEAFGAELVRPGGLDLGDGFADHADRRVAACG
jgi:hypothetical protein